MNTWLRLWPQAAKAAIGGLVRTAPLQNIHFYLFHIEILKNVQYLQKFYSNSIWIKGNLS